MTKTAKFLEKILTGHSDAAIPFKDLRRLLALMGFEERIHGSHYIYSREGIVEIINLQPCGSLAKPYQVKQVRQLILYYRLGELL